MRSSQTATLTLQRPEVEPSSMDDTMSTLTRIMSMQDRVSGLTDRQVDLLVEVALGKTNAQIADDFCAQEQTIKNRVRQLMKKLRADNRVHLATLACLGYPPSEAQLRAHWGIPRQNPWH